MPPPVSSGSNVYVTGNSELLIFDRNTSTGALSGSSTIATGDIPVQVCISADGKNVYVANYGSNTVSIFDRNLSTGALSGTSTIASGNGPRTIGISSDGISVYVSNILDNTFYTFNRNISTGALSVASTTSLFPAGGIAVYP